MIHATSIVDPLAQVDPTAEIGPWCTIGPHVKIGARVKLMSHVVVEGHTEIGEETTVFSFTVFGAVPQDLKYKGEPTQLIIGKHNSIRECVTMNLGTVQGGGVTRVGDHNLIMAYTHLGHDCVIGNHCIIANSGGLAGHVTLEDYSNIGGQVGIAQFVRVGQHSFVGGQSGVDKDVPPFSIVIGSHPCEVKSANIVGLRRRGFSDEAVNKLNKALKLWGDKNIAKEDCLKQIETEYGDIQEIQQLLQFIRESKYGTIR